MHITIVWGETQQASGRKMCNAIATLRYCLSIMFRNKRCFKKIKSGWLGLTLSRTQLKSDGGGGWGSTELGFKELVGATN